MSTSFSIKLSRTAGFDSDDYGGEFEIQLDQLVGGKDRWRQPKRGHRTAKVLNTEIKVKRCEDGPDFVSVGNLILSAGQFVIATLALWFSIPKREKEQNGERFLEVRSPEMNVKVKLQGSKLDREKVIRRILKLCESSEK
jgi:hypothetical protein